MNGRLSIEGGRYVLTFERRFDHPVDRVWRAVTEPEEMAAWFPGTVTLKVVEGAPVTFSEHGIDVDPALLPNEGLVVEVDAPRRFAFTWGDDLLTFTLESDGAGCRLVFSHAFAVRTSAPRTAAGWTVCLDTLSAALDGSGVVAARWPAYYERYVDELGTDGTVEVNDDGALVLRHERLVAHPAGALWAALTEPVAMARWLGEATLEPLVGGAVAVRLTRPTDHRVTGRVTAFDPLRVVAYTWSAEAEPDGEVRWQLIPVGPSATLVLLSHMANGRWTAAGRLAAWDVHLSLLATALAGMPTWPFPDERWEELRRRYGPAAADALSAGAT